MLRKLWAISKNTFIETLRQPIFAVITFIAILIFILSPSLTMYSLDDDNKLLKELGFSTLFLSGLFIAIFSSIGAITEELDSKTALTVLSKPVPRIIFVIGKFFGVLSALILSHYISTIAMILSFRHGVLQNSSDDADFTVITVAAVVLLGAIIISTILNFSYDFSFTATCTGFLAILGTIGLTILYFIDRDWKFNPQNNSFEMFDVYASILILLALVAMVSVAIMVSTRFNIVMTLLICIAVFLVGLISDYVFARYAGSHLSARLARIIFPNLQVFWISDAIYQKSAITIGYIGKSALYAISYSAGILALAGALFQSKQVGKSH